MSIFRGTRSAAVLRVADLFHPIDALAVESLRDRDVTHGGVGRGPMPVLSAGRNPDDVARPDLFFRPPLPLHPAEARGDDQRLAQGMRVPCRAGARLERDNSAADARGRATLEA